MKLYAAGTKEPIRNYETLDELCLEQGLDYQHTYNQLSGDPCNDAEYDGYDLYAIEDTDGGVLYLEGQPQP